MKQTLPILLLIASTSALADTSAALNEIAKNFTATMTLSTKGSILYGNSSTNGNPGTAGELGTSYKFNDSLKLNAGVHALSASIGTTVKTGAGVTVSSSNFNFTIDSSTVSNTEVNYSTDWTGAEASYTQNDWAISTGYRYTSDYDGSDEGADNWGLHTSYVMGATTVQAGYDNYGYDSSKLVDFNNSSFGVKYKLLSGVFTFIEYNSKVNNVLTGTTGSQTNFGFKVDFK